MKQNGFANIALVVVIVILVGVVGYFVLAKANHLWPFWKIYQDTELGYQFKYPSNYLIREVARGDIQIENEENNSHYSVEISNNPDRLTALEYVKKRDKLNNQDEPDNFYKAIIINDIQSVEAQLTSGDDVIIKAVLIPVKDKFVQISYGSKDRYFNQENTEKTINEKFWKDGDIIVSSFKLLK